MSFTVSPPVVDDAGWAAAPATVAVTTRVVEEPPSIAEAATAPPPAPSSSAADSVAAVREGRNVVGIWRHLWRVEKLSLNPARAPSSAGSAMLGISWEDPMGGV